MGNISSERAPGLGLFGKVLAAAGGVVLLVAALAFSLALFTAAVAGGLVLWGYLWWKTRKLRKHLREHPPGGHVIEGELIRDAEAGPEAGARRPARRSGGSGNPQEIANVAVGDEGRKSRANGSEAQCRTREN